MKKYIQITAGRGPVECARAVTLVARELLKVIPMLQLADCEPHNQEGGCFMSMTFATDEVFPQSIVKDWQGTILWRSTKNPYRPTHKRCNWFVGISFFDEVKLPQIEESDIVYEACRSGGKGDRMSTKSRLLSGQRISPPDFLSNAPMNDPSCRTKHLQENDFY